MVFLKCFLIVSSNCFLSFFAVSTDSSSGSFSDFSDFSDFLDFFESRDSRDIFLEFCDFRLDVDFVLVSEFSDSLDFSSAKTVETGISSNVRGDMLAIELSIVGISSCSRFP